jgi:adenine/guanine phosphoribosyltransferase-like PRPP-binding protein
MEWTQFQRLAAEYATKMNLRDKLRVELNPQTYDTIMHMLGLSTVKDRRWDYVLGRETDGVWLVGCVHVELVTSLTTYFNQAN